MNRRGKKSKKSIPGVDISGQDIDIKAALDRRREKGLRTTPQKVVWPLTETLLEDRVKKISVNMKAPLAPFVATMVGIGKTLINKKGQDWHLDCWMLFTQEKHLDRFNGDVTELLLWDTSRDIDADRIHKLITRAAGVNTFEEFPVDDSYQHYNLFLGLNLIWNYDKDKKEIGVYCCNKLLKNLDLEKLPDYVLVRPPYGFEIFSVPNSQPPKYDIWGKKASKFEKDKIVDSVLSSYFMAEEGIHKWTVLRPHWGIKRDDEPDYDLIIAERKPVSTLKDRESIVDRESKPSIIAGPIFIQQPDLLTPKIIFENYLSSVAQRRSIADSVDSLLGEYGLPSKGGGWDP